MIYNKLLVGLSILSAVLMIGSFLMPPIGIIDNSVIMAAGEVSFLATLTVFAKAIDNKLSAKMSKGDKSIEIK